MTEFISDYCGPDELRQLNHAYPDRYPFLLQSTAPNPELGRFDILFAFPADSMALQPGGRLSGAFTDDQSGFLPALDRWWRSEACEPREPETPFSGGWFLYLAYELAGEIEPTLELHDDPALPVAFAVRCPVAVVFDHRDGSCRIVAEGGHEDDVSQLHADLEQLRGSGNSGQCVTLGIVEDEAQDFIDAVVSAKTRIAAGDVYQANLSRQWQATVSDRTTTTAIYASLCESNPAPFAGVARWGGTSIISSSPERLIKVSDGEISTRPIAGTRRRGHDAGADEGLSSELFQHPKERAEHVMLIDLERNDIGRVCEAGTVEVDEMMVLESYAHVHHIVSNIRGKLRDNVTPGEAIAAVFPGGTITGCPKVRCMQVIDELERAPRGAYTGSFGYLNLDGSMDLNILIRTMIKQGDNVTLRAGAGIVADSEPLAELDEARAKAEGMLRALDHD